VALEELVAAIRSHGSAGQAIRPVGGGTKLSWGGAAAGDVVDLETGSLDRIVEHNVGDFTAVLEAGVRVADAQEKFAAEGQMLALDPPLGAADGATVGGMVATADSGPLRHRYGGVRDLIVGITVVLSDGTVAKAGGKVIKNVAGYDLSKLFTGSFGTLGLIAEVSVRLHPRPATTATVTVPFDGPDDAAPLVGKLAALPLEADSFDVVFQDGRGRLEIRFGGAAATDQAESAAERVSIPGAEIDADDEARWSAIRAMQRSHDGIALKVSGRPADLGAVLRAAADHGGTAVSRAALGLSWLALPADADVAAIREALSPRPVAVLDGADRVEQAWPAPPEGTLAVMARVKERFDPARIFRPGAFVGGI
jgi:glycolate oxidase FAD binding subunit